MSGTKGWFGGVLSCGRGGRQAGCGCCGKDYAEAVGVRLLRLVRLGGESRILVFGGPGLLGLHMCRLQVEAGQSSPSVQSKWRGEELWRPSMRAAAHLPHGNITP